jgi:hypothetical protein
MRPGVGRGIFGRACNRRCAVREQGMLGVFDRRQPGIEIAPRVLCCVSQDLTCLGEQWTQGADKTTFTVVKGAAAECPADTVRIPTCTIPHFIAHAHCSRSHAIAAIPPARMQALSPGGISGAVQN